MVWGVVTIPVLVGVLSCIPRFSTPGVHIFGCDMGFTLLVGTSSAVPYFGVGCDFATSSLYGSIYVFAGTYFVVVAILVFGDLVGKLLEGALLKKFKVMLPLLPRCC
jgi:hypothetical protein